MDKNDEKKDPFKKANIEDKDGLKISYDKEELDEFFPHLVKEISGNQKSIKIDSVEMEVETNLKKKYQEYKNTYPEELYNPGAVDFIRRCTTQEEALNILDYLLKRKEISTNDYKSFKKHILKENGLEDLINKHGGVKKPGYYEKKYRSLMQQKPNQKNE